MSLASDYHTEATTNLTYADGNNLWYGYGRTKVAELKDRKVLEWRVVLGTDIGGTSTFRQGFIDGAEADGFTVTPLLIPLLTNDFMVSW